MEFSDVFANEVDEIPDIALQLFRLEVILAGQSHHWQIVGESI